MGKRSDKFKMKRDHILNHPEKVTREFDLRHDNIRDELEQWVVEFRAAMMKKHWPENLDIQIQAEEIKDGDTTAIVHLICNVGETDGEVVDAPA